MLFWLVSRNLINLVTDSRHGGRGIVKHLVIQLLVIGELCQVSEQNLPLSYLKHVDHIDCLLNADQFSRPPCLPYSVLQVEKRDSLLKKCLMVQMLRV